MVLYDPKSPCADEFINHQEILDTLAYADEHKDDIKSISDNVAEATKGATKTTARAIKEGLKDFVYCKHCGAEIDTDSKFCKACGKKL